MSPKKKLVVHDIPIGYTHYPKDSNLSPHVIDLREESDALAPQFVQKYETPQTHLNAPVPEPYRRVKKQKKHALKLNFMRNTLTVRAADAVIMISGGIGTLNELTVAYEDKPTVVLGGTGGWADRIREIAYKGVHLEESGRRTLHYAATPKEAVDLAVELAHTDARARRGGQLELR